MKHSDFKIGTKFQTCTGQCWKCTDVGVRTILAIEIKPDMNPNWFKGPPYVVPEIVFNERDIERAYRSIKEATTQSVAQHHASAHPGFPADAFKKISKEFISRKAGAYPNKELLKVDRIDLDGEILHPYAAERNAESGDWEILVYRLFDQGFKRISENELLNLRYATESAMQKRKKEFSKKKP